MLDRKPTEFRPSGDILVADRRGTTMPFSKGLMAASIMATGLPPEDAHRLARRIAEALVASERFVLDADDLIEVAADVLRRARGPRVADRYLAWRTAKRSARPIIVLIGGVSGVGKSALATKLAARLDLPQVVPTDAIRQIMRCFMSRDDHPEIHRSSFSGARPGDAVGAVRGFADQAETVVRGVTGLIDRFVTEQRDGIVEGVHVVPGMFSSRRLADIRREAVLVQVLLVIRDGDTHRAHFHHRSAENSHGRDPVRYLERLWDIRSIQDDLETRAARHDVPVVVAGHLDTALQTVISHVVEAVVADDAMTAAV